MKKIFKIGGPLIIMGASLSQLAYIKNDDAQSQFSEVIKSNDGYSEYSVSDNWKSKIIYQIFPISFRDSDGDGYGDINGITNSIPYFKKLGINAIWLNPISKSDSYHKYDVIDYTSIDKTFGDFKDFDNMISQMKKNGIKIILDLAVNHMSTYSKWFRAATNLNDPEHNKYKDFFKIEDETSSDITDKNKWLKISDAINDQSQKHPNDYKNIMPRKGYFYSAFQNSYMADLNLHNPDVRKALVDMTKFWIDKGVEGFRLDAARHAYDSAEYQYSNNFNASQLNQDVWANYTDEVTKYGKSQLKDIYVVAENAFGTWWNLKQYTNSYSELDFPFYYSAISLINKKNYSNIFSTYIDNLNNYRKVGYSNVNNYGQTDLNGSYKLKNGNSKYTSTTFISNHDNSRIASILPNVSSAKELGALQMLLSGIPVIYYGDELGLKGLKNGVNDYSQRQPMPWGDNSNANYIPLMSDGKNGILTKNDPTLNVLEETKNIYINKDTKSMADESALDTFSLYQKLIKFRKISPFLYNPDQIFNYNTNNKGVSGMKIRYGNDDYLIFANFSDDSKIETIKFPSYITNVKDDISGHINKRDLFYNNQLENKKVGSIYNILGDYSVYLQPAGPDQDYGTKILNSITINSHSIIMIKVKKYD